MLTASLNSSIKMPDNLLMNSQRSRQKSNEVLNTSRSLQFSFEKLENVNDSQILSKLDEMVQLHLPMEVLLELKKIRHEDK